MCQYQYQYKYKYQYPYEYEFITDEKVKKFTQKEGLYTLNWVNQSTSINNPIITNFKILNYNPEKPNGNLKGVIDQRDPKGKKLLEHDYPMEIRFGSVDGNSRMSAGMTSLLKYIIELPIPQELSDSNSVTWGEDRVNALEMAALEVAQGVMATSGIGENAATLANAAVTALNTGISIPGLDSDTQGAVRAAISGAAVGALGSNVSAKSVISRSTGQIMNNNLELLFQGVNLRSFPFTITFSPRDANESALVKEIIRRLKQSMAPKVGDKRAGAAGGIFLKSPDVFQLKYLNLYPRIF